MNTEGLPDWNSAEDVVRAYARMVYRLAFARTGTRYDADEVFQEVFLRYIRKHPAFRDGEHCKAWLIRVTVNCCSNLWNSPWKRRMEPLTEDMAFQSREDTDLWEQLQKLPDKYREVVHLFYYEQMSLEEISQALHRKNSTVRTQLTRARAMLKTQLEEDL